VDDGDEFLSATRTCSVIVSECLLLLHFPTNNSAVTKCPNSKVSSFEKLAAADNM
jgi:hypothetical protein